MCSSMYTLRMGPTAKPWCGSVPGQAKVAVDEGAGRESQSRLPNSLTGLFQESRVWSTRSDLPQANGA